MSRDLGRDVPDFEKNFMHENFGLVLCEEGNLASKRSNFGVSLNSPQW